MNQRTLIVVIEAPDGHTWKQKIDWRSGESVKTAIGRYKKMLGKSYWICDWYIG